MNSLHINIKSLPKEEIERLLEILDKRYDNHNIYFE